MLLWTDARNEARSIDDCYSLLLVLTLKEFDSVNYRGIKLK